MEARNVKASDVIDQETIKHPWSQNALASVPSESALCEICPCLFIVVCQSPIYNYLWLASKIDVVLFPALVTSRMGTHISYRVGCCMGVEHASSELSRELTVSIARSCPRERSAPAGRSLRGTVRFAVPARVSVAEARRRLAFRGWKTDLTAGVGLTLPFLSFLMPDLAISSSEELVSLVFCLKRKEYKTNKNIKKKTDVWDFNEWINKSKYIFAVLLPVKYLFTVQLNIIRLEIKKSVFFNLFFFFRWNVGRLS